MGSTPSYRELDDDLNAQLARTAVFLRAAFHVHSPESYDWARDPTADRASNDQTRLLASPAELVDRLAASFDLVCITDRMRSGFATELASLAENRDDITIFPGVEVSVRGAQLGSSYIHLLAVFPPSTKIGAIERIYARHASGSFPTDGERTGREVLQLDGTLKACRVDPPRRRHVHYRPRRRGDTGSSVAVPGHARRIARPAFTSTDSSETGEIDQQTAEEYFVYLAELAPDAIEIMNPGDRHHYAKFTTPDGRVCRIPCVSRSDHHSVEDLLRDEFTTHMKVSRPGFDCVRDALRFFETRIRFRDESAACQQRVSRRSEFWRAARRGTPGGQRAAFESSARSSCDRAKKTSRPGRFS